MKLLIAYRGFKPFDDREAWLLFKLAAFGEAVGWSLLIIGITLRSILHGNQIPVTIAGQIHGTLFLIYIIAAIVLGPSLGWPLWRITFAGLCSVPPYGSLIYEQISAYFRSTSRARYWRNWATYIIISYRLNDVTA